MFRLGFGGLKSSCCVSLVIAIMKNLFHDFISAFSTFIFGIYHVIIYLGSPLKYILVFLEFDSNHTIDWVA